MDNRLGIRDFLEVLKFQAGPVDAKLIDAKAGYNLDLTNRGAYEFRAERYVKINAKEQAQMKTKGIDAKLGAIGVDFSIYSKRRLG